jgi:hypothetical protein
MWLSAVAFIGVGIAHNNVWLCLIGSGLAIFSVFRITTV